VPETPFDPDVVAAVTRHMNDDHAADSLAICRTLGGQPDAEQATMAGLDADGVDFTAVVGGRDVTVRVPFSAPVADRGQVRAEVVRMAMEARAARG
jgi:putative heme iron utilization protein